MKKIVKIYTADSLYAAEAVRDVLTDHGIASLIQSNEIPMYTGFNFGAGAWGDVLVDEEHADKAGRLAKEFHDSIFSESPSSKAMPGILQFNSSSRLFWIWAIVTVFESVLLLPFVFYQANPFPELISTANLTSVTLAVWVLLSISLALYFYSLNEDPLSRTLVAGLKYLLTLPVFVLYLLYWIVEAVWKWGRKAPLTPGGQPRG